MKITLVVCVCSLTLYVQTWPGLPASLHFTKPAVFVSTTYTVYQILLT